MLARTVIGWRLENAAGLRTIQVEKRMSSDNALPVKPVQPECSRGPSRAATVESHCGTRLIKHVQHRRPDFLGIVEVFAVRICLRNSCNPRWRPAPVSTIALRSSLHIRFCTRRRDVWVDISGAPAGADNPGSHADAGRSAVDAIGFRAGFSVPVGGTAGRPSCRRARRSPTCCRGRRG